MPWSPHFGISFEINCRPATIKTLQLIKPKPLPIRKTEKGQIIQWECDDERWEQLLDEATTAAIDIIDMSANKCPEAWTHTAELGITGESRRLAIDYAKWSIAAEQTCR